MVKIKNFPENSRITFLGSIFKDIKSREWNITVGLENNKYLDKDQKYTLNHARFSNMPLLARNRRFNQTKNFSSFNESLITIKIDDLQEWDVVTNKSNQYHFSHIVSDIHGKLTDIEIILPQIELARVLFFHNAYLSRGALDQGRLTREFDIIKEDHQTLI